MEKVIRLYGLRDVEKKKDYWAREWCVNAWIKRGRNGGGGGHRKSIRRGNFVLC